MKAIILLFALLSSAEANYQTAIYNAKLTEGSDSEIEEVMESYGFHLDANDTTEVSMGTKILALRSQPEFSNH